MSINLIENKWEIPILIETDLKKRMKKDLRKKIRRFVALKLEQFQKLEELNENETVEEIVVNGTHKTALNNYDRLDYIN